MAKLSNAEIIEALKELSILELRDLVKECEEEFGVVAAGAVVVAGGAQAEEVAEKTEFDVEFTDLGSANKVKIIKLVRELTGFGLKEAKDAVEAAPKVLKEACDKAEAEDIKAKFEAEGAKITLK